MREVAQRGVTIWFTGWSGAGKTTIAKKVYQELSKQHIKTELLDGDELRQSLCKDLGFSEQDRYTNIERAAYVAKLLTKHDVICLAAFISPYRRMRERARAEIGAFYEVYVTAPVEELIKRDVKGLYKQSIAGKVKDLTGMGSPYEEPLHPDLVLQTSLMTIDECKDQVLRLLREGGYL
ncbi:adenylyl-sulfate kinase [Paenibacillus aquistagni]|uniref:adenylyl-sulfate kinase n=1 Tax=Paenibacillus aquistagni TaxID=1852522 RepID=UPI0024681236|nr:adenylyl-sulfate kinase [Paenibacillus aquistagni]